VVPPVDFIRSQGITEYPRPGAVGRKNVEWRERMYDPELTFMDMQVGRLVHWLRNQDQWDDTLTVITADHGQGLLDGLRRHGWVRHRFLYDWCLRVPLIVRAPLAHQGTLPQGSSWSGRVVDAQVRTIDILPSILELLGVEPPQLDGLSFWRLAEELEETPRIAFADALNLLCLYDPAKGQWPEHCVDNLYSVSDGTWKLIYHAVSPENHELFHLLNDPLEATNLALQHPEHVGRLTALLLEQEGAGLTDPVAASSAADAAPDQLEKLQALGYIER
jgi:arylsulfatase A-like enzyme